MTLLTQMLVGLIGCAYAWYGKKNKQPVALVGGVAMMVTPYLVAAVWLEWLITALLAVGVYYGSKLLR